MKTFLPAASRLSTLFSATVFLALPLLSGCGGNDSTGSGGIGGGSTGSGGTGGGGTGGNGINPTPRPSNTPGTSRDGALADGCGGQAVPQPGWTVDCTAAVQPKRKWTVLLYMNGANDLEEYGNLNLNQIEKFGGDGNVTFVAQFKRIKTTNSYDDASDGDWVGGRRIVVRKDNNTDAVTSPVISTRADLDMGDPETLKAFVKWGTETFPAERYAIVLWNHGAGWRSRAASSQIARNPVTRGFSYDDEKDTHIDTIELPAAIDLGAGRKWDLVAWDSSLMQMVEVAHEIKDKTNWIVGSEESPPGRGYPYDRWVNRLLENPNGDGRFVGEIICDAMIDGYGVNSNITESVLDASKIAPLTAALNNFGAVLSAAQGAHGAQIADARETSESYEGEYNTNKDVLDFVRLVKEKVDNDAVRQAANAVETAARAAIVKNVNGNDHPNSQGIALYIPTPNAYRRNDISQANGFGQRYTELLFTQDAPNWQSFLTSGPP